MAETLGTAELILTADTTRLQAGLNQAQQQAQGAAQKIGVPFQQTGRRIDETTGKIKELGQEAQTAGSKLSRLGGGAGGGIAGAIGTGVGIGALVAGLRSAVLAAAELESVTRRLSNTLGQQGAQGALGFIQQLSSDLGLSFQSLTDGFASFTAAASAAGVPLEQQKELFTAVARSGQALGLSNDAISGSLLALQQVAAKGVVQMEELRGQLGERLPIAFAATARGLGITQTELIKLVESGKLTSDQFFAALTKGLNELNSGTKGIPTATQNFQKLSNAIKEVQTRVGGFFLPGASGIAAALSEGIEGALIKLESIGLSQSFGFKNEDALGLVGYLRRVRNEFGLTEQQAKNLVSDALKAVNPSRNVFGGLELSGQQLADVMGVVRDRAIQFTQASRTAREEQEALAAEGKRRNQELEQIEKNRLENAQRLTTANRDQLAGLIRTRGLQGEALSFAQDQLAIERARRDAAFALSDVLAVQDSPKAPAAAAKQAANALAEAGASLGVAIEEATRRAADRLKAASDAVRQAAETLRGAREGFAGAVGQQFAIATNEQRLRARQINEERIRAAERAGAFDPARVATRYGLEQTSAGLNLQNLTFRQLERLAGEVGTLANAETNLQTAMTANTTALQELAKRKWEVQVNVRNNANGTTAVDYVNNLR